MRPILSWLLLCLVSFHWIGGHVYFKVINIEQVKSFMSETEEEIASSIEQETGLQTEVEIIKDNEIIEAIGYSNVFVFNKKINGELHQYIIDSEPQTKTKETIVDYQSNLPNDLQNKIVGKLFPKLFNSVTVLKDANQSIAIQSSINNQVASMKSLYDAVIPLPPPNQNC